VKWKRKKQEDRTFIHIANEFEGNFKFIISKAGGYITIKRYFLEIFGHNKKIPSITLLFFTLVTAKQFAQDIYDGKPVMIESIRLGDCY